MKYIDTAGRVEAFIAKRSQIKGKITSKTEKTPVKTRKRIQKELEKPETLAELRN